MSSNLNLDTVPTITGAYAPENTQVQLIVASHARLQAIDIVRGLVMVLMALDHVRDYFMGVQLQPLDAATTTLPLYLTRWITHLCAPTFIFLAGVSIHLMSQRLSRRELSRFLWTRGLWLVCLEVTVVSFAWTFNFPYRTGVALQVIWAIGLSMILMGGLIRLSRTVAWGFALVLIIGHNLTDAIVPASFGDWALLWNFLHVQGRLPIGFILYPLVPWVGVMALGYVAGGIYSMQADERRRILLLAGASAISVFVVLRFINGYGDPTPWSQQATLMQTLFAFFDVEKYPPSLLYLLITLGVAALLLASAEHASGGWVRRLRIFGRVPLFFYVLHLGVAHLLAGLAGLALGRGVIGLSMPFYKLPADWNMGLLAAYGGWLCTLLIAYPLCKWFGALKQRRSDWWLSYL